MTKKKRTSYKHLLYASGYPEEWDKLYRVLYKRLKRHYYKKLGYDNPLFEVILEKVAYLTTKIKYAESTPAKKVDGERFSQMYNRTLKTLLATLEKLMKYTETTKKKVTQETINKEVKELTDEELNKELKKLIGGGKTDTPTITTRETKA